MVYMDQPFIRPPLFSFGPGFLVLDLVGRRPRCDTAPILVAAHVEKVEGPCRIVAVAAVALVVTVPMRRPPELGVPLQ